MEVFMDLYHAMFGEGNNVLFDYLVWMFVEGHLVPWKKGMILTGGGLGLRDFGPPSWDNFFKGTQCIFRQNTKNFA